MKVLAGMVFAGLFFSKNNFAADLRIHLDGPSSITRVAVRYQCDAAGARLGLPSGPFTVEYINDGLNSLAILPVAGRSLITSNVISGSGARYTAQQYVWWEAGFRSVSFASESIGGKVISSCERLPERRR